MRLGQSADVRAGRRCMRSPARSRSDLRGRGRPGSDPQWVRNGLERAAVWPRSGRAVNSSGTAQVLAAQERDQVPGRDRGHDAVATITIVPGPAKSFRRRPASFAARPTISKGKPSTSSDHARADPAGSASNSCRWWAMFHSWQTWLGWVPNLSRARRPSRRRGR
ncbi:hypothetical protein HNR06_004738 [Nocardiopsis arvandica]|uniref:Uncharacterized protein n=1 Tax=Nocardiopsis sinuspersici TaxID=501010 RepID=A0A7Y9XFV7_9ACTN|nr:hypothetical protein [Nocardiopsis sinuspersici]